MNPQDAGSVAQRVAALEIQVEISRLPSDASVEERLRVAMRAAKTHWMLSQIRPTDGFCVQTACLAVIQALGVGSPEAKRVIESHKALSTLSGALEAAQRGVPVDWEKLADEPKPEDPIDLLGLWRAATA